MTERRVFVVEDDAAIRRGLIDALTFAGYQTLQTGSGTEASKMVATATFDLLLLDLVLPGASGFEILRTIRSIRPTLPVIILTARGEEGDRIQGLQWGADDYVVKPFSVRELLARVEAVLRRSPERSQSVTSISFPKLTADLSRRELRYESGERVELSERECEVLGYLAANPGRAISRDELLQRLWRLDPKHVETRTIDVHIANIRSKLRDDASEPHMLLTVRGKGYMLGKFPESNVRVSPG